VPAAAAAVPAAAAAVPAVDAVAVFCSQPVTCLLQT
jgi:hypothetical protein